MKAHSHPKIPTSPFIYAATNEPALAYKRLEDMRLTPRRPTSRVTERGQKAPSFMAGMNGLLDE
jgi:hypothetical protein